jgi:hypothetical protein
MAFVFEDESAGRLPKKLSAIMNDPDYELLSEADKAYVRMRYAEKLREERQKRKRLKAMRNPGGFRG